MLHRSWWVLCESDGSVADSHRLQALSFVRGLPKAEMRNSSIAMENSTVTRQHHPSGIPQRANEPNNQMWINKQCVRQAMRRKSRLSSAQRSPHLQRIAAIDEQQSSGDYSSSGTPEVRNSSIANHLRWHDLILHSHVRIPRAPHPCYRTSPSSLHRHAS